MHAVEYIKLYSALYLSLILTNSAIDLNDACLLMVMNATCTRLVTTCQNRTLIDLICCQQLHHANMDHDERQGTDKDLTSTPQVLSLAI